MASSGHAPENCRSLSPSPTLNFNQQRAALLLLFTASLMLLCKISPSPVYALQYDKSVTTSPGGEREGRAEVLQITCHLLHTAIFTDLC